MTNHPAKLFARVLLGIILLAGWNGVRAVGASDSSVTNVLVPKRGGTLRLALPADVSALDPARAFDAVSELFLMIQFQGLVEYDDGVKLLPCLAKDWDVSEDRRTYTFHLRPAIRFSNGREVVAADFVYSLERNLDPQTAAPTESYFEEIAGAKDFRAGKTAHVSGIRAPSPDTLVLELETPDPSFLYILTLPGALVVPREAVAQFGSAFNAHPVGTGPYRLTEWRRGIKMRFERNPFYAQPERQYLDAIEVLIGGDTTLHLMMFEHGELDLADCTASPGIPEADFIRIQHTPRWHNLIERMEAGVMDYMVLNTEMKPFDDLRVRQAMNYAVDKDKLVRLHHGMAAPAKGILPSTMPGFNPNLVGYSFDPAKARRLLAAAGYTNGFSFKLWCWNSPQDLISASAIAYDLEQVGIHAEINPVAFSTLVDSMERRGVVQCSVSAWSQDYPDPSDFLDVMFNGTRITDEGCQNNAFFNNPHVNQLLAEAATCQDPERRLKIYQSVEQIVVDDAPYVFLYQPYIYALHQPWLYGVKLHPVLYFRFERMWLDR